MDTLEELKEDIARKADKEKYEAGKLKAKDDLNAVPEVFLSVTGGERESTQALTGYIQRRRFIADQE